MKLDKRIEKLSDILTCFDIENARQFIGQNGYFSDYMSDFKKLDSCEYGTLEDVFDDEDVFQLKSSVYYYFVPECLLKSKEKKYRPYTLNEFLLKYKVGSAITLRIKNKDLVEWKLMIMGHRIETLKDGTYYKTVYIGSSSYTLQELFDEYEVRDPDTDTFIPFGVEE